MRPGFDLWLGKIPQRRKWQPTPVFLPGESHSQRSLAVESQGVKHDRVPNMATFNFQLKIKKKIIKQPKPLKNKIKILFSA